MKALVFLVVLIGGIVGAVYYFSTTSAFDPTVAGKKAFGKINPTMNWEQVADVAGEPRKYGIMILRKVGNVEVPTLGPEVKYQPEVIKRRIEEGSMPHGFVFQSFFSAAFAFSVTFDQDGFIVDNQREKIVADLLYGPCIPRPNEPRVLSPAAVSSTPVAECTPRTGIDSKYVHGTGAPASDRA